MIFSCFKVKWIWIDLALLGHPFRGKIPTWNEEVTKAVRRTAFVFLYPRSQIAAQFYQCISNTKIKQACFCLVDTLSSFHSLLLGHKKTTTYVVASFFFGCPTWIRTKTNCTKNSRTTIILSGNPMPFLEWTAKIGFGVKFSK